MVREKAVHGAIFDLKVWGGKMYAAGADDSISVWDLESLEKVRHFPTGVPHLQENAPPLDPTVGVYLGSYGGGRFLMGEERLYLCLCGHTSFEEPPAR